MKRAALGSTDLKCDTKKKNPLSPRSPDKADFIQPKSAGSASKKSKKLMERSPEKKSSFINKSQGSPAKEKFNQDITDLAGKKLPKIVSFLLTSNCCPLARARDPGLHGARRHLGNTTDQAPAVQAKRRIEIVFLQQHREHFPVEEGTILQCVRSGRC
jgi:hypothetical protein